jgi:hypothetical protein
MTLRVLFADDQLPSPVPIENERTRSEIRRELGAKLSDFDAAFDDDARWFRGLLDYLETSRNLQVIRVRSFDEASNKIERPQDFDIAVVDLSWWGDAKLPIGSSNRENVGTRLIERLSEIGRDRGLMIPVIAYSQNFKSDFELMSHILDMGALPVPKSYDEVGYRALYSAIRHLARICRVSERLDAAKRRVGVFVSHAHQDSDIAKRLINALEAAMRVPDGAIRCTSVQGYKLDLGSMPADVLRRELVSADIVVAILTPHSLASQWVLFELGAAWIQVKQSIPLLAGNIREVDLPGPLSSASLGRLDNPSSLVQFLDQVEKSLGWQRKETYLAAIDELMQLAADVRKKTFEDDVEQEVKASFTAKRARIGAGQTRILDHITHHRGDRPYFSQQDLQKDLKDIQTDMYYRLEQLRYLGFLTRQEIGKSGARLPIFGWRLSDKYKTEIG